MKSINVLKLFLISAIVAVGLACGQSGQADESSNASPHGEGKEYTSAYICPMHCTDSGSDEMGTCPVCGMDYVAQAEHVEDGHTH